MVIRDRPEGIHDVARRTTLPRRLVLPGASPAGSPMTGRPLEIQDLASLHPGIPRSTSPYYAAAAAVCLQRRHRPPKDVAVELDGLTEIYEATWLIPTSDEMRSFANYDEATRDGAYCVALAAAHAHLAHVALRRTEGATGADWFLVPLGSEIADDQELDLEREDLLRLEVSGIDADNPTKMHGRLREKVQQARRGRSPFPAYAVVVGFAGAVVGFAKVE
jgi:hypothetical protein